MAATQLKIFTDTNILHASQAHLLVSNAIFKYVAEHKSIESIELKWFLPEMVIEERRHQMVKAALNIKPKIDELEKLLGHSLAISPEIMEERVKSKIDKTIKELGFHICNLDTNAVNWKDIIHRSARREPPFETPTENEKGFRDAIIAESFLQEVDRSPKTPKSCTLVFVSGDKRINEYLAEKTSSATNVKLLKTLEELKSYLNAISSEITEEFLRELEPKASKLFYDFEKQNGLYNSGEVYNKIINEYAFELSSVENKAENVFRKENSVSLGQLTFINKTGQIVVWSSAVSLKFTLVKNIYDNGILGAGNYGKGLGGILPRESKTIATGHTLFNIIWQHQISAKGNLTRPKIREIVFVENEVEEHIEFD